MSKGRGGNATGSNEFGSHSGGQGKYKSNSRTKHRKKSDLYLNQEKWYRNGKRARRWKSKRAKKHSSRGRSNASGFLNSKTKNKSTEFGNSSKAKGLKGSSANAGWDGFNDTKGNQGEFFKNCLLYTSPSPRDRG